MARGVLRRTRARLRPLAYGTLALACGVAALEAVPLERVPRALLPTRVLLDGFGRLLRCGDTGLRLLADYKMTLRDDSTQAEWDAVHLRSAQQLVALAERNGGLFIKLAQVMSNMSHLLPRAYTSTMRSLQDDVAKRPTAEVLAVVEAELGPLAAAFKRFDERPLAAASLAQVHRATLHDGREVAVKAQYLDVAQRFKSDLAMIRFMLGVCGVFFKGYDFGVLIERLESTVEKELNFVLEADNSDRAGRDLRPAFGDSVITPVVVRSHTTPRVLVTEFFDGVRIDDRASLEARGIDVREAARLTYEALAYQIFSTGFAHADPHAGNILVRQRNGRPQVVLLDHGLCVEVTEAQRRQLARLWTASVTHDTPALSAVAAELGVDNAKLLASMFLQHPYELFAPSKAQLSPSDLELMRRHAQEQMEEVNAILRTLPPEFSMLLRNITAVRATSKQLGNPVSRPLAMLRRSLPVSHAGHGDRLFVWRMLLRSWWEEAYADAVMRFARWRYPELMDTVDDVLQMG